MADERSKTDERSKANELALSQIEKQFGKGSIMRLGSKEAIVPDRRHSHRIDLLRCRSLEWADFRAAAWSKFSDRSRPAKQLSPCR